MTSPPFPVVCGILVYCRARWRAFFARVCALRTHNPACMGKKFVPPTPADVRSALQVPRPAAQCSADVVQYYTPMLTSMAERGDARLAPPLQRPRRGDWLDEKGGRRQTYTGFLKQDRAAPAGDRSTIAMVVLGGGLSDDVISKLHAYVAAFYQCPVAVLRCAIDADIKTGKIRSRAHEDTGTQIWCGDAMAAAVAGVSRTPGLANRVVATIGITMYDLTPSNDWNFVYGQARRKARRGVFSLARFSPAFNDEPAGAPGEADAKILSRAAKVLTHELGHMFGLNHCVYFTCLMGGVNHAGELIHKQPHLECPVCTQKLLHVFNWDLRERYASIACVAAQIGIAEPAARLEALTDAVVTYHERQGRPPTAMGRTYIRDPVDPDAAQPEPPTKKRRASKPTAAMPTAPSAPRPRRRTRESIAL